MFRAFVLAAVLLPAAQAEAQDLIGFDRASFGNVVLNRTQSAGAEVQLELSVGSYNNESITNYSDDSVFAQMGLAVGRLDILTDNGIFPCTAFIVDQTHLLTNHHCVPGILDNPGAGASRIDAVKFVAGYTQQGVAEGTETFTVIAAPVEAHKDLDYALLEVIGDPSARWGALDLSDREPKGGDPYWVIGHPMGEAQRISREQCRANRPALSQQRLLHTCDTLPGNSGSPVIDASLQKVVGLHHAGSKQDAVNFAIPMRLILERSEVLTLASVTAPDPKPDPKPEPTPDPKPDPAPPSGLSALQLEMLADPDVQACDRLAGSEHHPDRASGAMVAAGLPYSAINGPSAEPRCRAALAKFPDHPRLLSFLGDALSIRKKRSEAAKLYRRAAERGDPTGETSLGIISYYGWGITRSHSEAIKWLRRAEAKGYPGAFVGLGTLHQDGRAVTKNNSEAFRYYQLAHDGGSTIGSSLLARMYENGHGIGTDPERAADLYIVALRGGINWIYEDKRRWTNATGKALQRRLQALGYYTGAIDGAIGPGSRAAMKALRDASL